MIRAALLAVLALTGSAHAAEVLVIGNSIAVHPARADIGWTHQSGMAATEPAADYAHILARVTGRRLRVVNVADVERGEAAFVPLAIEPDTDLVVVQLGDNVQLARMGDFLPDYRKVLATAKGRRLVCVSTWWQDPAKDAAVFDACTAARGQYVFIGDIFVDRNNPDRAARVFADKGVDDHPHDWGMARIAERVVKAAY